MAHAVVRSILESAINGDWSRFDLAASCYATLSKTVVDGEAGFLSTYCMGEDEKTMNPNLLLLRKKKAEWSKLLAGQGGRLIDSAKAYSRIQRDIDCILLKRFHDMDHNELTLVWFLLLAIDESCTESGNLRSENLDFPLNQLHLDVVGVYLTSYTGFIDEHFATSRFERIPELTFNGQLDNLLFYSRGRGDVYPNLVTVRASSSSKRSDAEGVDAQISDAPKERIRIGIEQFSGAGIFGWDGEGTPLVFSNTAGDGFVASYTGGYEDLFGELVRESVDHAIAAGCDVLVFPEFVVSLGLSEILSKHLKESENRGTLKLVVAGSGWIDGKADEGGDNVSRLYDGNGDLLGEVYKRESFVGWQRIGKTSHRRVERLAHPGKEITVVDVPGLGRVMTAICKDAVSDRRGALDLARDMQANLLCVPALSVSLRRAFETHLNLLSERNLSVGCVCNLCSSRMVRDEGESDVSLVSYPGVSSGNPRRPEPRIEATKKDYGCVSECKRSYDSKEPHSCLWVATITGGSFGSGECEKNGLSVRVERYNESM